jgi:hypothetical protein
MTSRPIPAVYNSLAKELVEKAQAISFARIRTPQATSSELIRRARNEARKGKGSIRTLLDLRV